MTKLTCKQNLSRKTSCNIDRLVLTGLTKIFLVLVCLLWPASKLSSQQLTTGFTDHGVATPVSNHRGLVATVDGAGRNVVLQWLFDHTGGYELLLVDAETGKSEEFPMPFSPGHDCPYSSILSKNNKFYTLFNSNFVEFDPVKRAFTFHSKSAPKMAMTMTEDNKGVIWAVTYPNSGIISFNPATKEFIDYGHVYKQNWAQYPRHMGVDDAGWIYYGLGNTASQIIAFDPVSRKAVPMLEENERRRGIAYVYADENGKVYGQALQRPTEDWYEFYKGIRRKIAKPESPNPKQIITGHQGLFHNVFPDGKRLKSCDLVERKLTVEDPKTKIVKEVKFNYKSEGAWVMGVATAPNGTITGGTSFPMRFFNFNPKTNTWQNEKAYGQFNTLTRQGDRVFFGGYPGGYLLDWKPSNEWSATAKNRQGTNPLFLTDCTPVIHRPHRLLAHPDGNTIIMSGTPEYGYTGGGLLFWDRKEQKRTLLQDSEVIPDQSTMSLVALPNNKLLGGTTTAPGTGGEKKAKEALLYIMDMKSKKIEWQEVVFPGAQSFTDLYLAPNGLVYGIADRKRFFVFDPVKQEIINQQDLESTYGLTIAEQGPRVFISGAKGETYMLFVKNIVLVEPNTFNIKLITQTPVSLNAGGDYLDGKIYFISGSHLFSYKL